MVHCILHRIDFAFLEPRLLGDDVVIVIVMRWLFLHVLSYVYSKLSMHVCMYLYLCEEFYVFFLGVSPQPSPPTSEHQNQNGGTYLRSKFCLRLNRYIRSNKYSIIITITATATCNSSLQRWITSCNICNYASPPNSTQIQIQIQIQI